MCTTSPAPPVFSTLQRRSSRRSAGCSSDDYEYRHRDWSGDSIDVRVNGRIRIRIDGKVNDRVRVRVSARDRQGEPISMVAV